MRRDYAAKKSHTYQAPRKHIRKDKLKREIVKRRLKIGFYLVIFGGFVAALVYWLFFSSLFIITDIEVKDEDGGGHQQLMDLVSQNLQKKILYFVPQTNYWLLSTQRLSQNLEREEINPPVTDITIKKLWPYKLLVGFKRRIPHLRIITEVKEKQVEIMQRRYLVDDQGVVVDDQPPEISDEPTLYLEMIDDSKYAKGDSLLGKGIVNDIIQLEQIITNSNLYLTSPYFKLSSADTREVKVYTEQHYFIYFNLDYSLQNQFNHLILSLNRVQEHQKGKLEYIDLRIKDRAYLCCGLEDYVY